MRPINPLAYNPRIKAMFDDTRFKTHNVIYSEELENQRKHLAKDDQVVRLAKHLVS